MSHLKERKEKNCLNCNAEVTGRFCSICGQENVEPKESFWSLATHFVYDIIHFDGKFFSTLKYLILRPGFLSKEYLRGRRASYLHPIRLYVFTSAIFFIIYFSFVSKPSESGQVATHTETLKQTEKKLEKLKDSLPHISDSAKHAEMRKKIKTIEDLVEVEKKTGGVVKPIVTNEADTSEEKTGTSQIIGIYRTPAKTLQEYDSLQNTLPAAERDGWFKRNAIKKQIAIDTKYNGDSKKFNEDLLESFYHSIPQMMFISVPLVALVFQLFYIRRRKEFFYVNHVIFLIHCYVAIFIFLLFHYGFAALYETSHWYIFDLLDSIIALLIFLYPLTSMYKFYKQGFWKTLSKYLLISLICLFIGVILVSVFFVKSLIMI